MISTFRTRTVLTALLLAAVLARAASPVDSEYAFAAMAERDGVQKAFLANFSSDAVACAPGPVNGVTLYSTPAPPGVRLAWYPARSDVAASGDLAVNTGPWTLTSPTQPDAVHGTFLSVWQRGPDGAWHVILDCGVPHAAPATMPTPLPRDTAARGSPDEPAHTAPAPLLAPAHWHDPVTSAETHLAAVIARDGARAAFARVAAVDAAVLAPGTLPVDGAARVSAWLAEHSPGDRWQHVEARTSQDGTLGYAWGYVGAESGPPTAAYVNVWRRGEPAGPWRLAYVVLRPLPKPHAGTG
jgi:ketosteroid isomerase-like protein